MVYDSAIYLYNKINKLSNTLSIGISFSSAKANLHNTNVDVDHNLYQYKLAWGDGVWDPYKHFVHGAFL